MRKMLGYGLVLLAIMIGGALAWLYTPDKRRAALEKEYADPPSVFLDVAGIRLHVRDTGPRAAPSIVLLHGFGSSLHTGRIGRATLRGTIASFATIFLALG